MRAKTRDSECGDACSVTDGVPIAVELAREEPGSMWIMR